MTDSRIMECAKALAIAFHGEGIAKSFPNGFYAASHTGFTGDDIVEFARVVVAKWLEQKPTLKMSEAGRLVIEPNDRDVLGRNHLDSYQSMNAQAIKEIG